MIEASSTNADALVACPSIEQTLRLVAAELNGTAGEKVIEGVGYQWPVGGQITVYVPCLPANSALIELAIREYAAFVDGEGRMRFPISTVEINQKYGFIQLTGDQSQITRMKPLLRPQPQH